MGITAWQTADVVLRDRFYFSKVPKQLTLSSSSSGSSSVDSSSSSIGSVDATEFPDDDALIDSIFADMSPLRNHKRVGMDQSPNASNQSTRSAFSSNDEASRDTMLRFDGDAEDLEVQFAQVICSELN